jgi:hypothetical protein
MTSLVPSSSGSGNPRRLLDPEGDDNAILVNIRNYWPRGTLSHPKRVESSAVHVRFGTDVYCKHSYVFVTKYCL